MNLPQACVSRQQEFSDIWVCGPGCAEGENEVLRQVQQMLGAGSKGRPRFERRAERRFPFPYVMHLAPVGEDEHGAGFTAARVVVVGKHLSRLQIALLRFVPYLQQLQIAF